MSKSSGSFFTFLIGILTGGILGILYAPDKGINTRDKLSFRLDKVKKQLEGFIRDLVDEKGFTDNEAKEEGEKIVKKTKDKAEQLLDDVNDFIGQIKEK